jgi:hypothetical protein
MATIRTTVAVAGAAVKNDGGTATYANAAAGSRVTNSPDFLQMAPKKPKVGSKVAGPETAATIAAGTDSKGVVAANTAGAYADMRVGEYIIRGYTLKIANIAFANGVFVGADWGQRRTPVPKESQRTIHITDWSYITGAATIAGYTNDSFGNDDAARPTRTVPGELVYMETGKIPTQDNYKPTTG